MCDKDSLSCDREEHGIGLPMACLRTGGDDRGPVMDRSFARLPGPSALGAPSALILRAWELQAPAPVVAPRQLGMYEAGDGLMAEYLVPNIAVAETWQSVCTVCGCWSMHVS